MEYNSPIVPVLQAHFLVGGPSKRYLKRVWLKWPISHITNALSETEVLFKMPIRLWYGKKNHSRAAFRLVSTSWNLLSPDIYGQAENSKSRARDSMLSLSLLEQVVATVVSPLPWTKKAEIAELIAGKRKV